MQNINLTEKSETLLEIIKCSHIKWVKKFLCLAILKLKKKIFYHYKSPVPLRDIDIEKVLVSKKVFFGKEKTHKYFHYLYNDDKVKPLHIMLPKTSASVKINEGQTKWIYFFIEDDELKKI